MSVNAKQWFDKDTRRVQISMFELIPHEVARTERHLEARCMTLTFLKNVFLLSYTR